MTNPTMLDEGRIAYIRDAIARVDKGGVRGVLAEFGTYLGGTAREMSLASPKRRLFVFDTFDGLSTPDRRYDGDSYQRGQWAGPLAAASAQLADLPVTIVVGEFPDSADGLEPTIALAHLDLNLYQPTLDALHFVWHRMPSGGVIILDDVGYANTPGIQRALDDFGAPWQDTGQANQAMMEKP